MTAVPHLSPLPLLPVDSPNSTNKPTAVHVEFTTPELPKASTESFKNIETVAFVVKEPKAEFELTPIILDEVRPDEILVEMKYSGICHTDIVLQQGLLPMVEFPAVFGHEGAGVVLEIGSAVQIADLRVGDTVALSFNTCGECQPCCSGHPSFCHTHPEVNHNAVRLSDRSTPGRGMDGQPIRTQYFGQSSFSKKSIVNEKCVVKCPYPGDLNLYAPLGCGFQTGAGTVLNVLNPTKDNSIAIFGLGSVGLAALMASKHLSTGQIIAVDIIPGRLELARELGATHTLNSREIPNVVEAIRNITNGDLTFAVDCTGIPKVIEDSVACLGPLGTAAIVGVPPPDVDLRINALDFLLQNKKLVGIIEGDSNPPSFIPELIALHRAGKFPLEKLCKTYHFSKFSQAIADMNAGKIIKPVIQWS